jgi:hypothetical protein
VHFFQLNEEFEGILGGGTVKKIADNWANCEPKIISVAQTSKSKAVVSILSFYSDLSVFGIQHFILIFYCQFCNILFLNIPEQMSCAALELLPLLIFNVVITVPLYLISM